MTSAALSIATCTKFLAVAIIAATDDKAKDASIHAAMSADAMMDKGDLDGYAVWKLIMKAVDELEAKERPGSAKLH